jgi:flavodoxin short chain
LKGNKEASMKKAIIIFGSTTGNTEEMAEIVKEGLEKAGLEAELRNATDASVEDLTSGHDVLLLGCPAYGDDTIELQEDFQDYYAKWNDVQLNGKPFAVFAPGDSSYEYFCGSVDMLEDKLKEFGGKAVAQGLKIDGDPGEAKDEIVSWAASISSAVQ